MAEDTKDKKVNPMEVFQVIGESEEANPEALEETAKKVGASPEVVELMENLPPDVTEPSQVVAAAADPMKNDARVEMEVPDGNDTKPELTIQDVTEGGSPEA